LLTNTPSPSVQEHGFDRYADLRRLRRVPARAGVGADKHLRGGAGDDRVAERMHRDHDTGRHALDARPLRGRGCGRDEQGQGEDAGTEHLDRDPNAASITS
jgi:hypothetical protein